MASLFKNIVSRRTPVELLIELLKLILGYPLYVFSFCLPRNRNKWICGSGNGITFAGNPKYFYIYCQDHKELQCLWISSNKKIVKHLRERNLPAYYTYGIRGLYHCLTAKVYIFEDRSKAINFWTSGNTVKINLWHGVGVKNLNSVRKSAPDDGKLISRILFPYRYESFQLLLTTSPMNKDILCKYFVDSKNITYENIYPRCEFLLSSTKAIIRHIKRYEDNTILQLVEKLKTYSKVYIYMPTIRSFIKKNFLSEEVFDLGELNQVMKERNQLMILKVHQGFRINIGDISGYSNLMFFDNSSDVYPILPFTDVLITDYSSIYYDYILMKNKGVLLYLFDFDDFKKNMELVDYEKYTLGQRVYNFEELIMAISNDCTIYEIPERDTLLELFWGKYNLHDMSQIYKKIKSIL